MAAENLTWPDTGAGGSPRFAGKDACPTVGVPMVILLLLPARPVDSSARSLANRVAERHTFASAA